LGASKSLSTTITAHAISNKQIFPNVSLPFFEQLTMEYRKQSGVQVLNFAPIVSKSNKALSLWEAYSVENQWWIKEGLNFQGMYDVNPGVIPDRVYPSTTSNNDYALPLWQTGAAPTNASKINLDLLSYPSFARLFDQVMATRAPVASEIMDLTFLYRYSSSSLDEEEEEYEDDEEDAHEHDYKRRLGEEKRRRRPTSQSSRGRRKTTRFGSCELSFGKPRRR